MKNLIKQALKPVFVLAGIFIFSSGLFASDEKDHGDTNAHTFNAGKMILEHIADSHEWHLWGSHDNPVSIPLPIMLYSSEKGFSFFMSSRFEHGHQAYRGYKMLTESYIEEHQLDPKEYSSGKIIAVDAQGQIDTVVTAGLFNFSMTKNVVALLVASLLLLWIMLAVTKSYKRREGKAPKGLQSFIEPIIVFVRDDIAKTAIGERKYKKFMPFLLTIFFFIWINNILGLVPFAPGGANVTGNIAVPIVMAFFVLVITLINGNKNYWTHIVAMPGVPKAVLILVTPLEIIGIFIKPIVLVIRLFANITAGHIVILVFISLIFIFGQNSPVAGYGVSIPAIFFAIFLNFLEILVGAIQAYVFTLLSAIYFGMAVNEAHH